VSAAKRAANRRNARRSTGPRTAAGKARAARNARRHGLTVSPVTDLAFMREAAALARAILQMGTDPESQSPESQAPASQISEDSLRHLRAMQIAIAHVRVLQVRRAKRALYARGLGWDELTRQLASLDRYEGRALARRKMAMRRFDAEPDSRNFASAPKRSHRGESVSDINRLARDSGPPAPLPPALGRSRMVASVGPQADNGVFSVNSPRRRRRIWPPATAGAPGDDIKERFRAPRAATRAGARRRP
jgi:hypothetical protein